MFKCFVFLQLMKGVKMNFSSSVMAYTKSVLLPFYLLTFVFIFGLFGTSTKEPYIITGVFLLLLSILLIMKNNISSKFSFDMKKNVVLKGNKNIFPRDIDMVIINKKGSLLRINLLFSYKGKLKLSNNIAMDELSSFLNLIKKSNKNYKVKNTTSPTAYPLVFVLIVIYAILFFLLNTSKKIDFPTVKQFQKNNFQTYEQYSFKVPNGFYGTTSEDGSYTFVDKNSRVIVVNTFSFDLDEKEKKYLSYAGINGYYDLLKNFRNENYSLLYTYLKNRSKAKEYYIVDYENASNLVFYKENNDSFFVNINKDNRNEALIFYFRNFSKEDFLALSDNIGSSLEEKY